MGTLVEPLEYELTGCPDCKILSFKGRETVSRLYGYELELTSKNSDLEFETYLDQNKELPTITIKRGSDVRYLSGIFTRFEWQEARDFRTIYKAWMEPPLVRLGLRRRFRYWQGKTSKEIVEALMTEWAVEFDFKSKTEFKKREYTVQMPHETDLDLMNRLMEEDGVSYYFICGQGTVKTRFLDFPTSDENWQVIPGEDDRVACGEPRVPGLDFIGRMPFGQRMRRTVAQIRDYENDNSRETIEHREVAKGKKVDPRYETFEYPGLYRTDKGVTKELAEQLSPIRMQEEQGEITHGTATGGSCFRLSVGHRFKLGMPGDQKDSRHPRKELNDKFYLVMDLERNGRNEKKALEEDGNWEDAYEKVTSCRIIPAGTVWRPPRITPRPEPITTMARVVGPPDEEIAITDAKGGVKVWLYCDRGEPPEENENTKKAHKKKPLVDIDNTSCSALVSHGWAGAGYGMLFFPRVGQEVLVLLHCDRQPIIIGRLYNDVQLPPVDGDAKAKKTHSVIRTKSYKAEGFNELRLVDDAGKERIYTHAQHDLEYEVLNDWKTEVKNDRTELIKSDQTVKVVKGSAQFAKTILIEGTGNAEGAEKPAAGGEEKITLKVGGSSIEITKDAIVFKSSSVTTESSGEVKVKGKMVRIN